MGWVKRGNQAYYYKSVREGDRVFKLYLGRGEAAQSQSALDEIGREVRESRVAEMARLAAFEAEAEQRHEIVMLFIHLHLIAAGYHRHRGQWRKRRVKKHETTEPAAEAS